MNTLFPECPGCGNAYFFREGRVQGYGCRIDACDFGCTKPYYPEIIRDGTVYKIFVEDWGNNWKKSLAKVSLRLGIPIKEMRKFRDDRESHLFQGRAEEIFKVRAEFETIGLILRIDPSFKYDVFDKNIDGKWPLTDESILLWKKHLSSIPDEEEVASMVLELKERGLLVSPIIEDGLFSSGFIVIKPRSVVGNSREDYETYWGPEEIICDSPTARFIPSNRKWIFQVHEYIPGPGPGDFREEFSDLHNLCESILDYYFGDPERMNPPEYLAKKFS